MQALKLDQKLKSLVANERKITHEILLLIQALDMTKSYRELGYSSLFTYLTKEIGYSDGSAQRRISSARLMKQVPVLENELKSGSLNLTQVALAQVAIRHEEKSNGAKISIAKKEDILEKLKSKSTFETQKILKENLPAFEIPRPKALPAGSGKVLVTMEFSEADWQKVQDLMEHFSHSVPDQKLESLILYWCKQVEAKKQKQSEKAFAQSKAKSAVQNGAVQKIEKNVVQDADQKMDRSLDQNLKSSEILLPLRQWRSSVASRKNMRVAIPERIQAQIRNRAQGRCEYVSSVNGRKCDSKHFLENEHIVPVAKGGGNAPGNLRLFCKAHNQLAAKHWGISEF